VNATEFTSRKDFKEINRFGSVFASDLEGFRFSFPVSCRSDELAELLETANNGRWR